MEGSTRGWRRSPPHQSLQQPRNKRRKSVHGSWTLSCKENSYCDISSYSDNKNGMFISLSARSDRFMCLYCRINFLCEKHLVEHMRRYHDYVKMKEGREQTMRFVNCQRKLETEFSDSHGVQSPVPSPQTPPPSSPVTVPSATASVLTDKTQTPQSGAFSSTPYRQPLVMTVKINKGSSSYKIQRVRQASILSPPATPELYQEVDSASEAIDVESY